MKRTSNFKENFKEIKRAEYLILFLQRMPGWTKHENFAPDKTNRAFDLELMKTSKAKDVCFKSGGNTFLLLGPYHKNVCVCVLKVTFPWNSSFLKLANIDFKESASMKQYHKHVNEIICNKSYYWLITNHITQVSGRMCFSKSEFKVTPRVPKTQRILVSLNYFCDMQFYTKSSWNWVLG